MTPSAPAPDPAPDPERSPRDLHVPVAPVGAGRRGRRAAWIALAVVAAAVAVGLASGGLYPAEPGPAPVTPPTLVAVLETPAPDPTDKPLPVPRRITSGQLVAGVRNRSLDDHVVLVDGTLRSTIDRLSGLPIEAVSESSPPPGDPARRQLLALGARGGSLVYLGSLDVDVPNPITITELGRLRAQVRAGSLYLVRGWLVVNSIHPCERAVGATPCPSAPPFLADDEPSPEGIRRTDRGAIVVLPAPPLGVDPGAVVTGGMFLVRTALRDACDGLPSPNDRCDSWLANSWEVVTSYDPGRAVRVVIP